MSIISSISLYVGVACTTNYATKVKLSRSLFTRKKRTLLPSEGKRLIKQSPILGNYT